MKYLLLILAICYGCQSSKKMKMDYWNNNIAADKNFHMKLFVESMVRSKDSQKITMQYVIKNQQLHFEEKYWGVQRSERTRTIELSKEQWNSIQQSLGRSLDLFTEDLIKHDIKGTMQDKFLVLQLKYQLYKEEREVTVKGMHREIYRELIYLTIATLEEKLNKLVEPTAPVQKIN